MAEKAIEKDILVKIDELLKDTNDDKFKELKDKISNASETELITIKRDLELNSANWDCKQMEELIKAIEKKLKNDF